MDPIEQVLDPVPIWILFVIFVGVGLAFYEGGVRIGLWWQKRTPKEEEGPTGILVGALLALMAFLLGVSVNMASDRYDQRRSLVTEEANSIGTTYLRAGYLPDSQSEEIRDLIREYVPLRIGTPDDDELQRRHAASEPVTVALWAEAEALAREFPESDVLAVVIESLNETIDLRTERIVTNLQARVPETVLVVLLLGSGLALGMVGYSAGLAGKRSLVGAVLVAVVLSLVLCLVIDLDRPRDGSIQVSQAPLEALLEDISE